MNHEIQAKIEQKNQILKSFGEVTERFEQKETILKSLQQQNKSLQQEIEELLRSDTLFALNHKRTIEKELDEAIKRAEGFETLMKQKYPLNEMSPERKMASPSVFLESISKAKSPIDNKGNLVVNTENKENVSLNIIPE